MKLRKIVGLIAFLTVCATTIYAQNQVIDRIVAVVGKNIIMQSDIEEQYMQFRLQGGIKGSASSIRCEILEDQLFRKLMLNQAELDSITVTDEQVEAEMEYRMLLAASVSSASPLTSTYFSFSSSTKPFSTTQPCSMTAMAEESRAMSSMRLPSPWSIWSASHHNGICHPQLVQLWYAGLRRVSSPPE